MSMIFVQFRARATYISNIIYVYRLIMWSVMFILRCTVGRYVLSD